MNEKLKKDVEILKSNVDALQKELADSLADKKDMTEDKVSQLSEKVKNAVNAFKDEAGEKLGELKKKGKEAVDSSRDIISGKPLTAVAIAFGAGLLTALVLCRCKK